MESVNITITSNSSPTQKSQTQPAQYVFIHKFSLSLFSMQGFELFELYLIGDMGCRIALFLLVASLHITYASNAMMYKSIYFQ